MPVRRYGNGHIWTRVRNPTESDWAAAITVYEESRNSASSIISHEHTAQIVRREEQRSLDQMVQAAPGRVPTSLMPRGTPIQEHPPNSPVREDYPPELPYVPISPPVDPHVEQWQTVSNNPVWNPYIIPPPPHAGPRYYRTHDGWQVMQDAQPTEPSLNPSLAPEPIIQEDQNMPRTQSGYRILQNGTVSMSYYTIPEEVRPGPRTGRVSYARDYVLRKNFIPERCEWKNITCPMSYEHDTVQEYEEYEKSHKKSMRQFILMCIINSMEGGNQDHLSKKGKHRRRLLDIYTWAIARHFPLKMQICHRTGIYSNHCNTVTTADSYGDSRRETWCADEVIKHAFYCYGTNSFYDKKLFHAIVCADDGHVITMNWARNNLRKWRNGEWHYGQETIDTETIMEDALREGRLPAYHGNKVSWRHQKFDPKSVMHYGVELELRSKNRADVCRKAVKMGMLGERDGSLHEREGIEIVAKPMTFDSFKKPDNEWVQFLHGMKGLAKGWAADGADIDGDVRSYGMHVNISRTCMSPHHQIKMICFIHNNRDFCVEIAGRNENHYTQFREKPQDEGALFSPDKYDAAAVRSNDRIEVRIFKSTINPHVFMKNVEFVDAVVSYTKPKETTFPHLTKPKFKEWLAKEDNKKMYPNLFKHIFVSPLEGD